MQSRKKLGVKPIISIKNTSGITKEISSRFRSIRLIKNCLLVLPKLILLYNMIENTVHRNKPIQLITNTKKLVENIFIKTKISAIKLEVPGKLILPRIKMKKIEVYKGMK